MMKDNKKELNVITGVAFDDMSIDEMAEAKVQERTPAFTEIEGASVPIMADSPKKLFILLAFVFLSFVGTIAWLYVRLLFFRHE